MCSARNLVNCKKNGFPFYLSLLFYVLHALIFLRYLHSLNLILSTEKNSKVLFFLVVYLPDGLIIEKKISYKNFM